MSRPLTALLLCALAALTGGCDQLGIESATAMAARKEADGKAVGAACRHAGRALEDCYALNRKVERAAIYAGWRDMNEYMHENKIDPVPPQIKPDAQLAATPADARDDDEGNAKPASGRKKASKDKADAS
jgi:hypothetical protein